jgi:murein DD-endopeptidase MepM/ murein hydrolase activator NlpD
MAGGGGAGGVDRATMCGIGRFSRCNIAEAIARGLFETGLRPRFADGAGCRDIDEHYAIDYSRKRPREQYHGGIDMPAPWGTPIIAAAAGSVVAKYGEDNSPRGIEIVLRHSPEETGLPVWTYTQYAHFSTMPALKLGQRVQMGQTLGPTGNSGTNPNSGGQSEKRRPAIHFAAFYSASDRYVERRGRIIPVDGYWMDPVALYRARMPFDSVAMKALPEAEKRVPIPYIGADGKPHPADTKLVWPYACGRG